jgi:(E)-4-hydroxy-3-methylbut-2-enyl-diphosphate synthase
VKITISDSPFPRRITKRINVGAVAVGGGAPISVQSMTITKTSDVEATLREVYALAGAGCDIVRITCDDEGAAAAFPEILARSPVPIVADIHFQYRLALAAIEAGVQGIRLNPGNIRKEEHIRVVARAASDAGIPIRVGVNAGSLDKEIAAKFGGPSPDALVASAKKEIAYLEDEGFFDIKVSVKASSVPLMIESYRLLAQEVDYPLHLGVTEAGPPPAGIVKCVAGIGTLLAEGIGDTIRFSLTADPVEEAKAGVTLLQALGLREQGFDLVACPSCGRAEVDVIAVAQEAQRRFEDKGWPLQVAVMGCVVNGPGEASSADIGIASGKGKGHLFIKGKVVRVVPEAEMIDALLEEAEKLLRDGVEARLAVAGDAAEEEAARTATELRAEKVDPNALEERVAHVREVLGGSRE